MLPANSECASECNIPEDLLKTMIKREVHKKELGKIGKCLQESRGYAASVKYVCSVWYVRIMYGCMYA